MSVDLQSLPFDPADAKGALVQLPSGPAVFALYGAEARDEPYIGRTPNLRVRLEKLLQPSATASTATATGRSGSANCVATYWFGIRIAAGAICTPGGGLRRASAGAHAPAQSGICAVSGRQSLPAHHRHAPAQPERRRTGAMGLLPPERPRRDSQKRRSSCFCFGGVQRTLNLIRVIRGAFIRR